MRKVDVDAFWVLESQHGWKVVLLRSGSRPLQGQDHPDCNYTVIADGLGYEEARKMQRRLET